MGSLRFRRILLKLGGEALAGEAGYGIDPDQADKVAVRVRRLRELGAEVAIVIGAGNLWRGRDGLAHGMERATADHMGMLATVMNALALADALQRAGVEPRVQTAIEMRAVAEPYIRGRAIRHLEKGAHPSAGRRHRQPVLHATDTAAALRAMEIDAEVLIKATKVPGVYDCDPETNVGARRFDQLTYIDALNLRIGVLDSTALTLCMDNDLPIIVLDLWQPGSLEQAALGNAIGTLISH